MSIAENIKYLRKQKGMTQKKLAEESGLAVITIQQYEAGKYEPKKDSLDKLKTALKCHIYELTDRPFTTIPDDERPFISINDFSLSLHTNDEKEFNLLSNYRNLNVTGKKEALKQVEELLLFSDDSPSTNDCKDKIEEHVIYIDSEGMENHPFNILQAKIKNGEQLTDEESIQFDNYLKDAIVSISSSVKKIGEQLKNHYELLNDEGKKKADEQLDRTLENIEMLTKIPEYRKEET